AGVEVPADGGQRDADHGRVERGHARAEHGRGHHPAAPRGGQVQGRGRRRCFGHETKLARTGRVSRLASARAFRAEPARVSYTSFTLNNIAYRPCGQTGWRGGRAPARLPSLG